MKSLTREQVLKEKQTHESDSIKELSLGHRALSDVSCLSDFRNLEKLDLRFNNLTSLEGLKSCVNLKNLSLVQNKLQSLKGIEELSKLTVLNAGKNKLKSMNEVRYLVNLRALILNDNEISSICNLDQMKDLNTIVLSRNPISEIRDCLTKMKNLSKISLSNCRIQTIGSSLKACIELKELRLAHNEIKTLPAELALNQKLQILDLGNNVIMRWSDLKVLGSLVNLQNLNLLGNPISENEKLSKKVRKLLPALRVFNARSLDKAPENEKHVHVHTGDDHASDVLLNNSEEQAKEDHRGKKSSKSKTVGQSKHRKNLSTGDNKGHIEKSAEQKQKKGTGNNDTLQKKTERARPKEELDVIDDAETSFAELFSGNDPSETSGNDNEKKRDAGDMGLLASSVVTQPNKKKKKTGKNQDKGVVAESMAEAEIGMGGASTWE